MSLDLFGHSHVLGFVWTDRYEVFVGVRGFYSVEHTQPQEPSPGHLRGGYPAPVKPGTGTALSNLHAPTVWGACMQCSGIHEQAAAYEVKCTNSRSS